MLKRRERGVRTQGLQTPWEVRSPPEAEQGACRRSLFADVRTDMPSPQRVRIPEAGQGKVLLAA